MKKLFLILAAVTLFSVASFAASLCGGAATVAPLGATGCSIGNLTFDNFSIANVSGNAPTPPSATNVQVLIAYVPGLITVTASPTLASYWQLVGNTQFAFDLNYRITDGAANIKSYQAFLGTVGGSTPDVDLLKDLIGGGSSGVSAARDSGTTGSLQVISPARSTINVWDNMQVASAGTNGSSSVATFRNEFMVPEPVTMALFGSGLLALGLVRRFRRS
jgi:hypothetical protein